MSVSIVILRGLVGELRARGLPHQPLLLAAGVGDDMPADLTARLSGSQWQAARRHAQVVLDQPGLGLLLGAHTSQHGLPILGHLVAAASDLREAIVLVQRYAGLVLDDLSIVLDEQRTSSSFTCKAGFASSETDALFFAEYWTATALRLARSVTPSIRISHVTFRHTAPEHGALYEELLGCSVRFSQSQDAVVFDTAALDVPNLHGDVTMRAVLREAADRLLASLPEGARLVERVRSVLRSQNDQTNIELDVIARRVGLSRRALARRLRVEGHTVTSLMLEERRNAACRELSSPDCCIKATAERLGYSEPSAFHRAFKRWTGETPAQYARAHRRTHGSYLTA
jgi:AraC-like DNA-binding protein